MTATCSARPDRSDRHGRARLRRLRTCWRALAAAALCLLLSAPATGSGSVLLFQEDFGAGHANSLLTWGEPAPAVGPDPLAANGLALRYRWQRGFENYNGAFRPLSGMARTLHVRLRLRQDAGADNSGIQKIVRFRANIAGHGPDTFRGGYRYFEVRLDYSQPGTQRFSAWVDGREVIAGAVPLAQPWPASGWLEGVMFLGTFNAPADTRSDWIDEIRIGTAYIGIDSVFASGFEPP